MKKITAARRGGFTLVELLIVIIIIGILAGMMMLSMGAATDSAAAARIINDLRVTKAGAVMFYADHNRWPSATSGDPALLNTYMDRDMFYVAGSADHAPYRLLRANALGRELIGIIPQDDGTDGVIPGKVSAKLVEKNEGEQLGLFNENGTDYSLGQNDIYTGLARADTN